jgi:hypothetical protein
VRVVDGDEQRPLLGGRAQQPEHGDRDREAVVRRRRAERERRAQGGRLLLGQRVGEVEQRPDDLEQPGVRDLGLALVATGAQDAEPFGLAEHLLEQRGLADARLAGHDDGEARAMRSPAQVPAQDLELAIAAVQHRRNLPPRTGRR